MTTITIKFDKDIDPKKLPELMAELEATCSEDSEGYSWCEGSSYEIRIENGTTNN